MIIHVHPNQIGMILGIILSLIVLLIGWPRRKAIGGGYLVAFSVSVTWWLIASSIESFVIAQSTKILWTQISYIGFTLTYPFLFLFVVTYIRQRKLNPFFVRLLMVIPYLTIIMAWTNSLHGWVWPGYSQGSIENNVLIYQHGFWFWIHVVYLYTVLIAGLVYLIANIIKAPPIFRRQLLIILAGIIFPIITGSMYVLGLEPVPGMDITPTGLTITGLFLAWGLMRYQLLDLLPVARTALIEQLQDGIIVLDMRGRIVDINQATKKLLSWETSQVIGKDFAKISPVLAQLVSGTSEQIKQEITLPGSLDTILEVHSSTLTREIHHQVGKLLLLRDITARKHTEAALLESEEKHRTFIEQSSDGITLVDTRGNIIEWNHAREELTGLKAEDVLGKPYWNIRYQLSPPELRTPAHLQRLKSATLEMLRTGKSPVLNQVLEGNLDTVNGETKTIEQISFPVKTRQGFGIGSVMRDISARKRTEDAIRQRVLELETINHISLTLRSVSKQDEMIAIVLDQALAIINTPHGSIELYNKATGNLEKTILRGWTAQLNVPPKNSALGMAGRVFTTGEIYISTEFANDPETHEGSRNQMPAGWGGICLPIRTSQQTLGVMFISVPSDRKLDKDETRLLETLSEITGSALQRMQLHDETARRAQEFESLFETSNAISVESDLSALLLGIVENARKLLNAASSGIYIYQAEREELTLTVDTATFVKIGTRLKKGEGVAGVVAQTRKPLRIDDYSTWEGRSRQYQENFFHAILEVPMLYGGELIGVLTADEIGESTRTFSEADERLLSLFASQAAGAIHSARLYQETVQRLDHLQALRAIDQAISSSLDMRTTLNILLTQTIAQLDVDAADVLLLNPDSNQLKLVSGRGFHTLFIESMNLNDSFAGRAITEHLPIMRLDLETASQNPQFLNLWKAERFTCYWCVPLIVKEQVKGVMEVYRRAPFQPDAEWLDFIQALAGQAAIAIDSTQLFQNLQRANLELSQAYDATIEGWSRAMDLRDHETEGHTLRVTEQTLALARAMDVGDDDLTIIRRGALLHDIGKLGIPDSILLKEGQLTSEEWAEMRKHPQLAHDMLMPITYLNKAIDIPYCHHEKWDGTGYPQGLKGTQIPLFARIFAILDVWDALTNDRPYRKKWTNQQALQFIQEQSDLHFDPQVVDIFAKNIGINF